jgi:broad specificity phosphatase PhoE
MFLFVNMWMIVLIPDRSPQEITERLDRVIKDIRDKYHSKAIGKPKKDAPPGDVLVVAHGHILRAFAGRWVNKNIADNPSLILEAGGVGTLRYALISIRSWRYSDH